MNQTIQPINKTSCYTNFLIKSTISRYDKIQGKTALAFHTYRICPFVHSVRRMELLTISPSLFFLLFFLSVGIMNKFIKIVPAVNEPDLSCVFKLSRKSFLINTTYNETLNPLYTYNSIRRGTRTEIQVKFQTCI